MEKKDPRKLKRLILVTLIVLAAEACLGPMGLILAILYFCI